MVQSSNFFLLSLMVLKKSVCCIENNMQSTNKFILPPNNEKNWNSHIYDAITHFSKNLMRQRCGIQSLTGRYSL